MREWLLQHAITDFGKVSVVRTFIQDYATMLNQQKDPDVICEKFGWAGPAAFMLGEREISADKVIPIHMANTIPQKLKKGAHTKGELKVWTEATEIFQNKDYWPHAMTLLSALGAPLFNVVNVTGAVLSLAGRSATGKTTSAKFGLSAFAEPSSLMGSNRGTLNAKGEFLRRPKSA